MFDDKILSPSDVDLVYDFLNQIGRRLRHINSSVDVYYNDIYGSVCMEYKPTSTGDSVLVEYKTTKEDGLFYMHDVDEIDPDFSAAKLSVLFDEYEKSMTRIIKEK